MVSKREILPKTTVDYFNIHDLKTDLKKHAIRGGAITVLSRAMIFLIQTISTMVLARILAPEEFGLVVMATAVVGFLIIFVDLGLTDATIQKTEINHTQISTLFWINAVVTFAIVLLAIAIAPLNARFYSEPRLINITIIWSTYLFFAALSTQHIALLKRRMLFLEISVIEIAAMLISSFLAIMLALNGWSYWALVFRQIFVGVCLTAGAWILCRWRPGLPSFRTDIRSMLVFGRNATGSFILGYFAGNIDKIVIGWSYGAKQLGYYDKAFYLYVLPATQLTESLKNVATSTLSKLRSEPSKYINYYLKAVSIISFIGMPISFFLMIESDDIVLLLLGPQWEQTVEIFRILAAGTGIWMVYSTKYWLHASLGRSDRLIRWGVCDFVMISIAVLVGLRFGPEGIAIAYTCALYLIVGPGIQYAGKPIGLKFQEVVSVTWKYFIAALFAGLLAWYILQLFSFDWPRFARLSISFFIYIALYLTLVFILYRNIQPILEFLSVIKEMFPKPAMPSSEQ